MISTEHKDFIEQALQISVQFWNGTFAALWKRRCRLSIMEKRYNFSHAVIH